MYNYYKDIELKKINLINKVQQAKEERLKIKKNKVNNILLKQYDKKIKNFILQVNNKYK